MRGVTERLARLRGEHGTTLVELMVALGVGTIVMLALFQLLDRSVGLSAKTSPRVAALQEGRRAMEQITQQLRSQVCLPASAANGYQQPAIVDASSDSVTFYAEFFGGSGGTSRIDKRKIEYEPANKRIVEYTWNGTGTSPNWSWPTLSNTRVLATRVVRVGTTPVFRYYAFNSSNPPVPDVLLTAPLAAADKVKAVKIAISFRTEPEAIMPADSKGQSDFQNEIYVRTADPTNPTGGTRCT